MNFVGRELQTRSFVSAVIISFLVLFSFSIPQLVYAESLSNVRYLTHLAYTGWENSWSENYDVSGGEGEEIQAIRIYASDYRIEYQAHVSNIGWQDWTDEGELAGTINQMLPMEAIRIRLIDAPSYVHIYYSVIVEGQSWQEQKSDGQVAGTTGQSKRIEAIRIKIVNEINIDPSLTIDGGTTSTGKQLTHQFVFEGRNFTRDTIAQRRIIRPDNGKDIGTPIDVMGDGTLDTWKWTPKCSSPTGTYKIWVTDVSGERSNYVYETVTQGSDCPLQAKVTNVNDGDTVDVDNKILGDKELEKPNRIRFTGIDAPELAREPGDTNECFAVQAMEKTEELVGGKTVWFELDERKIGGQGRVLAYVYPGLPGDYRHSVNYQLVNQGYAKIFKVEENLKYVKEFRAAQIEAVKARRGMWSNDSCAPYAGADVLIGAIKFWGSDEIAIIVNRGDSTINLKGWELRDDGGDSYKFNRDVLLEPGGEVRIHSGPASIDHSDKEVKWTSSYIWDEGGDTGYLIDSSGQTVHRYAHKGFGDEDKDPPATVKDFDANDGDSDKSVLRWTNPPDSDLSEVEVRWKLGSFPSNHNDGHEVNCSVVATPGASNVVVHEGLRSDWAYRYAVFTRDSTGNWNDRLVKGDNADLGIPAPVRLRVPYYNQSNKLWCTEASVAMILDYFGINRKPWRVASDLDQMLMGSSDWFTALLKYLNFADDDSEEEWVGDYYNKFFEREKTIRDKLIDILDTGSPVWFAFVKKEIDAAHAVVITGYSGSDYDSDYVYFHDPSNALSGIGNISGSIEAKMIWSQFFNEIETTFFNIQKVAYIYGEADKLSYGNKSVTGSFLPGKTPLQFWKAGETLDFDWNESYPYGYVYQCNGGNCSEFPESSVFGHKVPVSSELWSLNANISNASLWTQGLDVIIRIKSTKDNGVLREFTKQLVCPPTSACTSSDIEFQEIDTFLSEPGTYKICVSLVDSQSVTRVYDEFNVEFQVVDDSPQQCKDSIALYNGNNAIFYLSYGHKGGTADKVVQYGPQNWIPLAGDWNEDGIDSVGLYDPSTSKFFLKNSNSNGVADECFTYGIPGWIPLAGDWNGDGTDTVGLYEPSRGMFYLKNCFGGGGADIYVNYGPIGKDWIPIVGDWNEDGKDTIGLYDPSSATFYLKNDNSSGISDIAFNYGVPYWKPISGDWNNDGVDTVGLYSPKSSIFYLKNDNTSGTHDIMFQYGMPSWTPLAGRWKILSASQISAKEFDQLPNNWISVSAYLVPAKQEVVFEFNEEDILEMKLSIYDTSGSLIYNRKMMESKSIIWNLTDISGNPVSNGIYLYNVRITNSNGQSRSSKIKKILVLR